MALTRRDFLAALTAAVTAGVAGPGVTAGDYAMTTYVLTLKDVVGEDLFAKAGLRKLSDAEQNILKEWIERKINDMARFVEEECRKGNIK